MAPRAVELLPRSVGGGSRSVKAAEQAGFGHRTGAEPRPR